jgi:hypothetical protein
MKQTELYLWYPLFQAQWDRCDRREEEHRSIGMSIVCWTTRPQKHNKYVVNIKKWQLNVIIIGDKKILFGKKKKKLKKTKTTDYHKKFSYTAIAKMLEFFLYWQHIYYVFVDVLFNRQSTFLCSYAPFISNDDDIQLSSSLLR